MSYLFNIHDILLTCCDDHNKDAKGLFDGSMRLDRVQQLTTLFTGHSGRLLDLTEIENRGIGKRVNIP